ncbi:cyclic AMP receptor-like protein [Peptococcaceae bacterium CEB3]|nr:cyclic AMP receptor-like protein [Peptococcaceae bacterium CEB3]
MCINKKELNEHITTSMMIDETTLAAEGLTPKIWDKYLTQSSGKKLKKSGESIIRIGENLNGCYFVKKGRIKTVFIGKDGTAKVISINGEGAIFGDQFVFHSQPGLFEGIVISDAEVYFFTKEIIMELCQKDFEISLFLMKSLAIKSRMLAAQLEDVSVRNTLQNLCRILYCLYCYEKSKGQPQDAVVIRLTHEELANTLGVHRVTITKILNKLKALGVLEYKYERITLINYQDLKEYAFE